MVLALSACSPTKSDIRSEIGSEDVLPPAKVYPGETISITLWNPLSDSPDQVSILIEPNRTLYVRKYHVDWSQNPPDVDTKTLDTKQLDEDLYDELRRRLSDYRPVELSPSENIIMPRGCDFVMDGKSVISVAFRDIKGQMGVFVLQESCVGPSASKIKSDLKQILSKLPELDGTTRYGWSEL